MKDIPYYRLVSRSEKWGHLNGQEFFCIRVNGRLAREGNMQMVRSVATGELMELPAHLLRRVKLQEYMERLI